MYYRETVIIIKITTLHYIYSESEYVIYKLDMISLKLCAAFIGIRIFRSGYVYY